MATNNPLTSINVSKSLSRLARSSFRFLFSAIKLCFFFSKPCRACSSPSRSESSWLMRANIKVFSSASASSGRCWRKSSTGIRGSCWYPWLVRAVSKFYSCAPTGNPTGRGYPQGLSYSYDSHAAISPRKCRSS